MQLLKELCETSAIAGREQPMIDLMTRELKKTCDEVSVDGMGNVIGLKRAKKKGAKKVMIAGHMDEIGFIVTHIDKSGFIRFAPRGGHAPRVLISQRVLIKGRKDVLGVVEGSPWLMKREDMQKVPDLKDLFIDAGLTHKELAKLIGVGDIIVLDRGFVEQGGALISKAFDDRIGCYVVLEAMRRIRKPDADIYAVGTSQEEVGIRGAIGAARTVVPDIGIAVDITLACDTPGVPEHAQITQLGGGVAIKINDMASISNHGIVEHLKNLARRNKIKYQMEVLPFGGTDARGMQWFGEGPVCTLSVPTRHAHSPNELIHKKDVEATIKLLVKFLENVSSCRLEF
ncbi:MAG: M42 family metallopeptidase [Elusimicrobiota bacterium]